jgi:fumarate hydratase subunit beta
LILKAPLSEDDVRSLTLGQQVYIDGPLFIGRDEVHMRALERRREGKLLPVDMEDGILYHCGPIVTRDAKGWKVIAAGPTTSARMNALEPDFIKEFGIRAIIGKGGMSRPTVDAMREHGCVYLAFTGGAAVLAAQGIARVRGVEWLDMGMPEALWIVEAKHFGPLIVAIDAHGNSLYEKVEGEVRKNLPEAMRRSGL